MKHLFIELLCRSINPIDYHCEWEEWRLGRPDCCPIYIPVYYAWQEHANDLHIQIEPRGDNLIPRVHESGDYIMPVTPWLLRHLGKDYSPAIVKDHDFGAVKQDGILVYHLAWLAEPADYHEDGAIAPKSYLKAFAKAWEF